MNPSDPAPLPAPVAIIGMGCLFPRADGLARYWANIRTGTDAITDVPESHWSADDYFDGDPKAPDRTYARRGGFLDPVDFPPLDFGIAPTAIEATDTTQLLGLMVARRALDDAGYGDDRTFDRERVSVILGVTGTLELVIPLGARLGHPIWRRALQSAGVDDATAEDVVRKIADSYVGWQEGSFPGLLGNVAAGRIANRLDLRGTNCVVDAACASSLGAVNLAILELAAGRSDVAVTGGLDTFNDIFMYMCFSKTPALSPTGEARPFDAEADGTILGEGLGVLVLKRLADARRDGDRVYAVIRSIGTSSDGKGQAVYAPSAAGQARALRQAYAIPGISPASVGLVEAHGTGTKVGDATELEALESVYRDARPGNAWCAVGSVKSQVGHTKAAAGAAGLIKAAMALHHKVLPPTLKVRRPAERLARGDSPFYVNTEARPWLSGGDEPRRAAVSAFGFGGSNFHCVLEEAEPEKPAVEWDGDVQILAFSADDRGAIARELDDLAGATEWPAVRAAAARGRAKFDVRHRHRLLIIARRGEEDWTALVDEARSRLEAMADPRENGKPKPRIPARAGTGRVFSGTGPRPGLLAMLFPGQGSQYVGMLRELACLFPRMQAALTGMNEAAIRDAMSGLASDCIYPPASFDDGGRQAREDALRDTRFAQPAIGAVSLGLLGILEDFGVRADVVGGHSFGELTAMRAAGRIDDSALAQLAHRRGAIMAACAGEGSGAMLAAFAPIEEVAGVIREHALDLVIANKNAPRQCVLSGSAAEVERCRRLMADRGVTTRVVPVSAAFHSRFVAGAREPFRRALDTVAMAPSTIPVLANATAAPYSDDPSAARDLLADQLARPVEFIAQIEAMHRMGARTFLEVGPDARLTGLVRSILERQDHIAVPLDASRGSAGNLADLACSLATLAALGYAVDLTRWDVGYATPEAPARKPGLTVRLSGANQRPRQSMPGDPPSRNGSTGPERFLLRPEAAAAHTRRFPAWDAGESRTPAHPQPRHHAENDRTMNPPERSNAHHHTNGKASPATLVPPEVAEKEELRPRVQPGASPMTASSAFQTAQENLAALQRMAEQTAELHRQFLEGQEKTQQTFLMLLEQQQRMARWAVVAPASETARSAEPPSGRYSVADAHPAPPPPEPARPASTPAVDALLTVVAEKTGYPAEVLELGMRLDDDLGIDSIKRVEILSALQERFPDLPAPPPDQLGSFQTLGSIAKFLGGTPPAAKVGGPAAQSLPRKGERGASAPCPVGDGPRRQGADAPRSPAPTPAGTDSQSRHVDLGRVLLETVAEKTGYPAEMLELDMRLDDDLGIDSIKRVEILSALQERFPDLPPASPEQIGTLRTLREIVAMLGQTPAVDPRDDCVLEASAAESVGRILIDAVAEKTGFPAEMLELDMRLDDDLGIDSIKRVEILSALQERLPETRSIGPEQTATLRTLREIVEFVTAPIRAIPTIENGRSASSPSANGTDHHVESRVVLRRLEPRALPLTSPERRESVKLAPGGEIWITDDGSPLAEALRSQLSRQGFRARVIACDGSRAPESGEGLCGLIVLAPSGPCDSAFIAGAFRTIRAAGPALLRARQRSGAALLTVSRLDGRFGVEGLWPERDPTSGALAGLAKTAAHEWPGVDCKALDIGDGIEPDERTAGWIVEELLARGPAEAGIDREGRVMLEVSPARDPGLVRGRKPRLGPGNLVVISGGARGITAEIAVAIAREFQPRLLVLGRTPAPEGDEEDGLAACRDETELKRYLLSGADRRRSPQAIGERVRQIMVRREIRSNLDRIAAAGSRVVYRSVDVRDRSTVRDAVARARDELGPIRGLIHGAGVLADRRIVDQTDAQFSLVYDTKVEGLHNLFDAVDPEALEFLVLFSSSTARFGRTGQVAYAAANEYLNKWAQRAAIALPDCRVVSFNWGPWAGGMVGDALRSVFEKEGLHLIPPESGARLVIDEIQSGDAGPGPVEIVVLADRPTTTPEAPRRELKTAPETVLDQKLETVHRRPVDLKTVPILADHIIDGHAVLPMAIMLEWASEGALHRNPGLVLRGVDDLRLFKGLIVGDCNPAFVDVAAGKAVREGDEFRVPVELRGTLPSGREVIHARAEVVLAIRHAAGTRRLNDQPLPRPSLPRDDVYGRILFHGPAMQGIDRIEGCGERGIVGKVGTAPAPSEWLERPLRSRWLTDPLAIDCAFQLMVLWTHDQLGANSLPTAVGRYRQFRPDFGRSGVRVVVEVRHATGARAVADVEFLDDRGELIARIESYECVVDASLGQAFGRNQLIASSPVTAS